MKKILSLLLVCTMIFSLATISIASAASATDTAYEFTYADGYFTITSKYAAMGGRLALRFETEKVKPLAVIVTGSGKNQTTSYEVATSETSAEVWGELSYSVAKTFYKTDDKYTYIGVDWYHTAEIAAGSEIGYLNIQIADESKLNKDSIVTDFTVTTDFISAADGTYGCVLGEGITTTQPVSLTYPNSTVSAGWTATGSADGENVTVTVKFPTSDTEKADATGASWSGTTSDKGTVVKSLFGKATEDLAAGAYSVEYNGELYYGKVAVPANSYWAILIIQPTSAN